MVGGRQLWLGNLALASQLGLNTPEVEGWVAAREQDGNSVVMLMDEEQVLALFAVADTVRPASRDAIAQLHKLGIRTVMLSGDNQQTASAIAAAVGIDEAHGGCCHRTRPTSLPGWARPAWWAWWAMASMTHRHWHAPTSVLPWVQWARIPPSKPRMWH
jgi:Cd2+/Zn2+-exporting ATPase